MLLVFFVFVTELVKASLVLQIPGLVEKSYSVLLLFSLYFLQLICAPLQGKFSDLYCRKKSLIICFIFITLSQLGIYFSLKMGVILAILGIVVYGSLGNADVIARAALIDTHILGSKRRSISMTFLVLPFAWIIMAISNNYFDPRGTPTLLISLISFLCIAFSVFFFNDKRDKDLKEKPSSIFHLFKNVPFLWGILAFLIAESGFQISYLYQENTFTGAIESKYTTIYAIGFALGVLCEMNFKFIEKFWVLFGVFISFFALIIGILMSYYQIGDDLIRSIFGYGLFTCGSGMYLPSLYSLYSRQHRAHEQGKVFGLLDSTGTLGEMIASFLLIKISFTQTISVTSSIGLFIAAFIIFYSSLNQRKIKLHR